MTAGRGRASSVFFPHKRTGFEFLCQGIREKLKLCLKERKNNCLLFILSSTPCTNPSQNAIYNNTTNFTAHNTVRHGGWKRGKEPAPGTTPWVPRGVLGLSRMCPSVPSVGRSFPPRWADLWCAGPRECSMPADRRPRHHPGYPSASSSPLPCHSGVIELPSQVAGK